MKSKYLKEKKVLRQKFGEQRAALSSDSVRGRSLLMAEKLRAWLEKRPNIQRLFFFNPLPHEPDLRPLVQDLAEGGYTFGLPWVNLNEKSGIRSPMVFYEWKPSLSVLKSSPFSALEQVDEKTSLQLDPLSEPTLILVPALAADQSGFRLGFGKGYYDEFFAQTGYDALKALAVITIFSEFLVPSLPRDPWDQSLPWICTEKLLGSAPLKK
ncbi:MAG: 5-formyltetrahydrofolate cyclo-ligase [Oligoflexales bacterium]|nr:5-formyltetrahydrofolate cyclo-ligase [Oligoflexales bacterium]